MLHLKTSVSVGEKSIALWSYILIHFVTCTCSALERIRTNSVLWEEWDTYPNKMPLFPQFHNLLADSSPQFYKYSTLQRQNTMVPKYRIICKRSFHWKWHLSKAVKEQKGQKQFCVGKFVFHPELNDNGSADIWFSNELSVHVSFPLIP